MVHQRIIMLLSFSDKTSCVPWLKKTSTQQVYNNIRWSNTGQSFDFWGELFLLDARELKSCLWFVNTAGIGLFPFNNTMSSVIQVNLLFTEWTLLTWDNTSVFIFRMNQTRAVAISPWAAWVLTLGGGINACENPPLQTSAMFIYQFTLPLITHLFFSVMFDCYLFFQIIYSILIY